MSKPQQQVTIAAAPQHWFDIFNVILQAVAAGNQALAQANVIPAPIEAGIQIGLVTAPIIGGVISAAQQAQDAAELDQLKA